MAAQSESELFKRLLAQQLVYFRKRAGCTQAQLAERISRTNNAVSRYETGEALVHKLSLETLCDFYGLNKEETDYLLQIHQAVLTPPWWGHLGPQSDLTNGLLLLERHAHRLRQYDLTFIPGLLQVPSYARAVNEAVEVDSSPEQNEIGLKLRMERQERFWSGHVLSADFLIDEAVLHRMPGDRVTQVAQLNKLLDPPRPAAIRIVPFDAGPHASMATYAIFDLDLGTTYKAVHVEGAATQQGVIAERDKDTAAYEMVFERTRGRALSVEGSAEMIDQMIRRINHAD